MPEAQSHLECAVDNPVVPAINGLRGISILLLVMGHYGRGLGPLGYSLTQPLPGYSVQILFVITGFIVTIAMQRAAEAGQFDVGGWLLRKAIRLYPTLIAILIVTTAIQSWKNGHPVPPARYAGFLTLVGNYYYALAGTDEYRHAVGHLWSIMVGAQFLIAWAIAFRWASVRSVLDRLARPLVVVVAVSMILRILLSESASVLPAYAYLATEGRVGEIAIGALAALWVTSSLAVVERLLRRQFALCAAVLLIATFFMDHWIQYPVQLLATTYLTVYLVGLNGRGLSRVLESRFLAGISLISYSIFTWHLYGLDLDAPLAFLPLAIRMPVVVLSSLAVGAAFYMILEWPVRRRTDAGVRGRVAS